MHLPKKLFLTLLFASFICGAYAQKIVRPTKVNKTSFAIVVDDVTLAKCGQAIDNYKRVLESEGLSVFVVSDNWKSPDVIRKCLKELYLKDKLEGAVFIGNIPVPMIQKAQHLTSAFKMNENEYPIRESSVPSDRFYDDFDLKFTFKKRDEAETEKFYYDLAADSPQYLQCDIYSGRIMPIKGDKNKDQYTQISDYLNKVVRLRAEKNPLDQFVSYTGEGSYSNSLTAWRAEQEITNEQFGDTFTKYNNAKYLRYSFSPYMKDDVINELRRDDLDFMVFHEHGLPHRQYLTADYESVESIEVYFGTPLTKTPEAIKSYLRSIVRRNANADDPYEKARAMAKEMGLDPSWFDNALDPQIIALDSLDDLRKGIILEDVYGIAPNARFVIFDACYNGDFRENDYIAGRYIFSTGKCVAAFANTVNVLQDKSAFDLLGLLPLGVRIGIWAQQSNILESHIIGDPTFSFTPATSNDLNYEIAKAKDEDYWRKKLQDKNPEIVNVALIKLYNSGAPISNLLRTTFETSPYAIVRYNCLHLLEKINDNNFREVLKRGVTDDFEFIRRISVHRMGLIGDEQFLPYLVDTYINDFTSARIVFNIESAISCFDQEKAKKCIEERFAASTLYEHNKPVIKAKLFRFFGRAESSAEEIGNKSLSDKKRMQSIASLKNVPYHQNVDMVIAVMNDKSESDFLRQGVAESLAWFTLSVKREQIADACKKLIDSGKCAPAFKTELQRAYNRLTVKN